MVRHIKPYCATCILNNTSKAVVLDANLSQESLGWFSFSNVFFMLGFPGGPNMGSFAKVDRFIVF